jgi:hypothetical protein
MSGVLDRMSKRALGRLPSVQPLIRSIYASAPVNPEAAPAPTPLRGIAEIETTVAPPGRAPARADGEKRPEPARPSDLQSILQEPRNIPTVRRAPPATAPTVPARPEAAQSRDDPDAPPPLSWAERPIATPESSVTTTIEDSTRAGVPSSPAPRIPQPSSPPVRRRRSQAAPAGSSAPADQKAEIHISIGSIELRPAPESKPAPPLPFRPRVSLEDFLGRKAEGRR